MTKNAQKNPIGRPTDYDAKFHPANIIELAKSGLTVIECCAQWEIDDSTYYRWAAAHAEFRSACTRARVIRQAFMIRTGRDGLFAGKDFNDKVYGILARTAYRMNTEERSIAIAEFGEAKTFDEKRDCVLNALASGGITVTEAEKFMSVLKSSLTIEEASELGRRIAALEQAQDVQNRA